jgi:hypothetical protein
MYMSGEHQEIDADLRGKYAELLQAGEGASDAVIQQLVAGDELQISPLFIRAGRNMEAVIRAEAARQELSLH